MQCFFLLFLLRGVSDPAGASASGGYAQLGKKPLRQDEPDDKEDSDSDPMIHDQSQL
jgi:hypothetical protein